MKYNSFISYSHRDTSWGDWLHKALETYRVPKGLIGQPTPHAGPVPARAYPVFRDREELPTADDLGAVINNALAESRYLIVISSPNSAHSRWVNQEIINFKRLGRENRVLAIIVDGEPNAAEGKPGFRPEQECFPPALKFKLGPDGNLSSERTEPIAADARSGKDGKANALLKLLAGVLCVNFDELRQRDAARGRRKRRIIAVACMAAVAAAAMAYGRFAAEQHEREFQAAVADLGRARQRLADAQPDLAAAAALTAIETAEKAGRSLEPAWWVLRRALDANRTEARWSAGLDRVSSTLFDRTGARLLTFGRGSGETKPWTVPEGTLVASLPTAKTRQLAAFTDDGNEIVTVDSIFQEPRSYNDASSSVLNLTWWDAITGSKRRSLAIPDTSYFNLSPPSAASPTWIVTDCHDNPSHSYRLVRLSDGWAGQKLPVPDKVGWGSGPMVLPECAAVLLVKPEAGVSLFSLAGDQAERGSLQGVSATEKLRLTNLVPSVDRTSFAGIVWSGSAVLGTGVWRAADGSLVTWQAAADKDLGDGTWMAAAGPRQITGNQPRLIEPLAAALGRTALKSSFHSAVDFSWKEPANGQEGPVVFILGRFNDAAIQRPEEAFEATAGDNVESGALSPDGRLAAIGDRNGGVTLLRTEGTYLPERSLPSPVEVVYPDTTLDAGLPPGVLLRTAPDRLVSWDSVQRVVLAEYSGLVEPPKGHLEYSVRTKAGWLMVLPSLPLLSERIPEGSEAIFYDLASGQMLGRQPAARYQLAADQRRALAPGKSGWRVVRHTGRGIVGTDLAASGAVSSEWASAAAFLPDSSQVVVARGNGEMEVFDSDTGACGRRMRFAEDQATSVNHLTVSPSGRWALLSTYRKWWRVDLKTGQSSLLFEGESMPDDRWQFFDGENVVMGNVHDMQKWWTFPEFKLIGQVRVESGGGSGTAMLSADGKEFLLKPRWREALTIVNRHTGEVRSRLSDVLAVDQAGQMAAIKGSSTNNGQALRVVRLSDGEGLLELPGIRSDNVFFAGDGSRVFFIIDDRVFSAPVTFDAVQMRTRAKRVRSALEPTPGTP